MTSSQEPVRLSVLIVEDEKEDFVLTRELLRGVTEAEYAPSWELTMDAGLEALRSGTFDACLVDFRLGTGRGLDFVRAAKALGSETPILVLTGYQAPGTDIEALEAGALDYLVKGSQDAESLHRAIRHAITRQKVLLASMKERTRLAAFSAEMGWALTSPGSIDGTLQACACAMAHHLPVCLVQIHVFNPQQGEFRRVAAEGPLRDQLPPLAPQPVDYIHGERCISSPAVDDHRFGDKPWLVQHGILTGVTCPLMLEQHLLGLITLHSREALSSPILEELGSVIPAIASFLARLHLEAQVRRTQQLDCVGKMAAGLAHEFKNDLAVIRTHVREATEALAHPSPNAVREILGQILDVTDSADRLAQQLMLFARPNDLDVHPLNLNESLLALRPMIQGAVDQRVSVALLCNATRPVFESNATLLRQIVVNLSCNARDAMPAGGSLTLETSDARVDAIHAATTPDAQEGEFLRLSIRDTGCGMSPETRARLFEPFFTTKPPGKGNGLGLATVFAIVREHRGWMEVESAMGQGTTFHIYFPVSRKPAARPIAPRKPASDEPEAAPVQGNQERVLIVEDEPVLRMAAEQVLRRANFQVTSAASGQEALKAWAEHGGRFDVLLTDLSMPDGLTGVQLASQLVRENPEIKVILTSGYAPEMVDYDLGGRSPVFLQKPYPPSALPLSVKDCLGI